MSHILTNFGEEWLLKYDIRQTTGITVGLYNDADDGADSGGDSISDPDDIGDITSEPNDSDSYERQTGEAITVRQINTDWGFDNDNQIAFNTSTNTETVDSWFVVAEFEADGDAGDTEHLVVTGALSQAYDLSNVDSLEISAGDGSGSGVGTTVS